MKGNKRGVSLIVLVITIIVLVIISAVVIISLSNTGIIKKAKNAVNEHDLNEVQQLATLAWSEAYIKNRHIADESTRLEKLEEAVNKALISEGVNLDNYYVTVTKKGVTILSKLVTGGGNNVITLIESPHNPYENNQEYIVLGTWNYSGATAVNIKIKYQTENTNYDWCSIVAGTDYVAGSSQYETRRYLTTSGIVANTMGQDYSVKFGDSVENEQTFTNVSMTSGSVIFRTDGSVNDYYGVKVEIIPVY